MLDALDDELTDALAEPTSSPAPAVQGAALGRDTVVRAVLAQQWAEAMTTFTSSLNDSERPDVVKDWDDGIGLARDIANLPCAVDLVAALGVQGEKDGEG